jgi:hypothetical protein
MPEKDKIIMTNMPFRSFPARWLWWSVFFVCLAVIMGCGGSRKNKDLKYLYRDPKFGTPNLVAGQVGICGVPSMVGSWEEWYPRRDELADILQDCMNKGIPGLSIMPADSIRSTLGEENYEDMLDAYELLGNMDAISLIRLDSVLAGSPRYIIMARIEGIQFREKTQKDTETLGEETITVGFFLRTALRVAIGLDIYDIPAGTCVWSGQITKSKDSPAVYDPDSDREGTGSFLGDIVKAGVDGLTGKDKVKHPPPPELSPVVTDVFNAFTMALPRPEMTPTK